MNPTQSIPGRFKPEPDTLKDKNVLVSGAASDTGTAVSIAAAQSGATVLLLDRKQRELVPVYDAIVGKGYPEPMMVEFDMLKASELHYQELGSSLAREFAELHGLVHCAAWGAPLSPLVNSSAESWVSIYDQQFVRPMLLTKSLVALLNHHGDSSIVFSTLECGRHGKAYWGGVGAACSAIENLSEVLSMEFEQYATRCNSLDPGKLRSALRRKFYPGESGEELRDVDDPEVLKGYLFLLSSQSRRFSGERFTVPDSSQD